MNFPAWMNFAVKEIGTRELPENRGPAIQRYIDLAGVGKQGWPWCAIFVNAMLRLADVKGTRSAGSQSFTQSRDFVRLQTPIAGCLVVFWRGSRKSGLGHVGFYNGERGDYISVVGGNESDMVREEMFPKNSRAFGLVGYYWPTNSANTPFPRGPFSPFVSNSSAKTVVAGAGSGKVT